MHTHRQTDRQAHTSLVLNLFRQRQDDLQYRFVEALLHTIWTSILSYVHTYIHAYIHILKYHEHRLPLSPVTL